MLEWDVCCQRRGEPRVTDSYPACYQNGELDKKLQLTDCTTRQNCMHLNYLTATPLISLGNCTGSEILSCMEAVLRGGEMCWLSRTSIVSCKTEGLKTAI